MKTKIFPAHPILHRGMSNQYVVLVVEPFDSNATMTVVGRLPVGRHFVRSDVVDGELPGTPTVDGTSVRELVVSDQGVPLRTRVAGTVVG